MDIFKLYRTFWNWCFENPSKIKPTHIAIYSFAIEHCNRLGWKKEFGFPTTMVMEAIGVRSYSVYKNHLDELVDFGFLEMIEISKNQYSANIIALKENYKAHGKAHVKALDKALIKHTSKQCQSTCQSIDSIDKQRTKNKEQGTKKGDTSSILPFSDFWDLYDKKVGSKIKLEKKWEKISEEDRAKIREYIPRYKKSQQDKMFRKNPETFLNNESWNDEIINETKNINNGKDRRDSETADRERQIMQLARDAGMA